MKIFYLKKKSGENMFPYFSHGPCLKYHFLIFCASKPWKHW